MDFINRFRLHGKSKTSVICIIEGGKWHSWTFINKR